MNTIRGSSSNLDQSNVEAESGAVFESGFWSRRERPRPLEQRNAQNER